MHFHKDLLFIVSGPLNHIASLFKIHPILSAGGTVCILDGIKDINAFFKVFDLPYEHFATFLVPASIRRARRDHGRSARVAGSGSTGLSSACDRAFFPRL